MRFPWLSTERRVHHKPLLQVPFFGRDAFLDALAGHLQEAQAGATRYVVLTGPAGSGKSALLQEFGLLYCTKPPVLFVPLQGSECLLPQEFYARLFDVLRVRSTKILQTLYNETKRLRKALAVSWEETEFWTILTSTDWAPLQDRASRRGGWRRPDPLAQLFTMVAEHPWAIGAAVILDSLTRDAARWGAKRHWLPLWTTVLHSLRARRLPRGTALVICIDQLEPCQVGESNAVEQWRQHWQAFTQAVTQAGLPLLVIWSGTAEGVAAVRQALQGLEAVTEHNIGGLSHEELHNILPKLLRNLPRATRSSWEQVLENADASLRLPAHLMLATTCAAAVAEENNGDAATLQTITQTETAALVQRLVHLVLRQQPAAAAGLFHQLLDILAFFPSGKNFVLDDVLPLCDLEAVGLDVVSGRAALEKLLGACVRYGLLEYNVYTSHYSTAHSMIQQALQAFVWAPVETRQAMVRRRQLATAVIHHIRLGESDLLQLFAQVMRAEAETEAALFARHLVAPLRRMLGQSTKAERQRIAEALGKFPFAPVVDLLEALLSDEEGQVRSRVAQALADLEGVETLPGLLTALQDNNSDVRWIAACALGKLDDTATVDALITLLSDEDKEVGRIAAEGLGLKGDRRAVPHLIAAMRDSYPLLRESAARALGQLADKRALPALQELLQDTHLQVRRSAEAALNRLLTASV